MHTPPTGPAAGPPPPKPDGKGCLKTLLILAGVLVVLAVTVFGFSYMMYELYMKDTMAAVHQRAEQANTLMKMRQLHQRVHEFTELRRGKGLPLDFKTSTEFFQAMMDEDILEPHLADHWLHIDGMPGKTPYDVNSSDPLKPENVCVDVIVPVDNTTPGDFPALLSTGWELDLTPGGTAKPDDLALARVLDGVIVITRDGTATVHERNFLRHSEIVPDPMPPGKTYRQLKP